MASYRWLQKFCSSTEGSAELNVGALALGAHRAVTTGQHNYIGSVTMLPMASVHGRCQGTTVMTPRNLAIAPLPLPRPIVEARGAAS